MSSVVDAKGYSGEELHRWIAEPNTSIMDKNKQQLISNKTNLLARSQRLAAESKAALLSEIDNNGGDNEVVHHDSAAPSLPKPVGITKLPKDKVTELLSQLTTLSSDISLTDLSTQLSKLIASRESYRKLSNRLDEDFERHLNAAMAAKKELAKEESELHQLQDRLDQLKANVRDKEQELAGLDKQSPAYQEALHILNSLKKEVSATEQAVIDKKIIVKDKVIAAEDSLKSATEVLKKQDELAQQNSAWHSLEGNDKKQIDNRAKLSELLAFFMQLIGKNSENQLKSQMSIFESMQKSVQKQMSEKAKETEEQQKKAEELQYTMGCIGKVIGALITVVSVVSATFTGGSSLVLAGVGLALMTGDVATEAATGQSLTDRLMEPFMEYVFLPLMGVIEKVVDKVLAYTPLGKVLDLIGEVTGIDVTGIAKTAISALVTIAIIVAVAYLSKGVAEGLSKKLLGSTISEALKNIVPQVAKDLVNQVAHSIEKALVDIAAKVGVESKSTALRALQLEKLMQYVSYSNQGAQVTSNVFVADFKEQVTESLASFKLSQTDLDNIKKILESVISAFENSQDRYQDIAKLIADSIQIEAKTGKQVLMNMRV